MKVSEKFIKYRKNYEEAIKEYKEAISKEPQKCASSHRALGEIYYIQKKLDDAIEEFKRP
jgi:tetratricopeptide (TPR) repeat protein